MTMIGKNWREWFLPDLWKNKESRSARRILIVENDPKVIRLLQVNLARQGYPLSTALTGGEGLERVTEQRPNLIVLDYSDLPDMDGYEFVVRLKREPENRSIPIIALIRKARDLDELRGGVGIECYLSKPFNPMELILFVKRIFGSLESRNNGWPEWRCPF